jgi:hypothetical protein
MSKRKTQEEELGPEGVPVDAPDNDKPAISPHTVSRMHRAEDDEQAVEHSPDFHDDPHRSDTGQGSSRT